MSRLARIVLADLREHTGEWRSFDDLETINRETWSLLTSGTLRDVVAELRTAGIKLWTQPYGGWTVSVMLP